MTEYTAVFVGTGSRGRDHVLAYDRIDGAEPVGCMARTDPRRDELADEFDMAAFDEAEKMLAETDPDIVHITTPPHVRVSVMESVSEASVPLCTVEKPIAVGVRDWRELRELESRTDTKFAVCHQFRWQPHLVECRKAIESGELGDVEFLDCSARLVLTDQGTHCLHYANSLNGDARIEKVFGNIGGEYHDDQSHPGPDATEALVTFEDGVRAAWATGNAGTYSTGGDGPHHHVRCVAYTDEGHAKWEEFGDWEIISPGLAERGDFGGQENWQENNYEAQAAFHKAMFEWLEGGDAPGTNLEHSLREWKAALALYESALSNDSVYLDEFDPDPALVDRVAAEF